MENLADDVVAALKGPLKDPTVHHYEAIVHHGRYTKDQVILWPFKMKEGSHRKDH